MDCGMLDLAGFVLLGGLLAPDTRQYPDGLEKL
jgi:hypothetical protein